MSSRDTAETARGVDTLTGGPQHSRLCVKCERIRRGTAPSRWLKCERSVSNSQKPLPRRVAKADGRRTLPFFFSNGALCLCSPGKKLLERECRVLVSEGNLFFFRFPHKQFGGCNIMWKKRNGYIDPCDWLLTQKCQGTETKHTILLFGC
jgi:hypothetical protein